MKKSYISGFLGFFATLLISSQAWAALGAEDIAKNITKSSETMPGLVSGSAYFFGLILIVVGILKLKEYVENDKQTPLRVPLVRLLVGGALFSLPIIFEAAKDSIQGNGNNLFTAAADYGSLMTGINGFLSQLSAIANLGTSFNGLLFNTIAFTDEIPGLISAVGYLLGIILAVSGVLKIREHVEEPEKVTIKEPIIRLLTAGAMFALPTVYKAMYYTIADGGVGFFGGIVQLLNAVNFVTSAYQTGANTDCLGAVFGLGSTLGDVICMSMLSSIGLPAFLTAISYVLGLIFGIWGVLKVRDHVANPMQTKLSEGVTRLLAAGAFFGMPVVATALQASFIPVPLAAYSLDGTTGYAGILACGVTNSLDQAFGCFVDDLLAPSQTVLNFFCFVAGLIFVMIGISRMIKTAQDGPRGPGGLGTVATFVTAGVLMSGTSMLTALTVSFFGLNLTGSTLTNGTLAYTAGMNANETNAAYNVVSAVVKFMIIVGLISFVRGIFILRDSAEGKQASVMSGLTHIIGGALAVNIGPVINAVQASLGITAFGVIFN